MTVQVQRRGAVTTLVLDRPQAMNAVDAQLGDALKAAVQDAAQDEGTRAVVLTGKGKAFCSGADLKAGFEAGGDGLPAGGPPPRHPLPPAIEGLRAVAPALPPRFHPSTEGLRTRRTPVMASVNGPAASIGLSFALACDLV